MRVEKNLKDDHASTRWCGLIGVAIAAVLCFSQLATAQPMNPRLRCGVDRTTYYRAVVAEAGAWSGEGARRYVENQFPLEKVTHTLFQEAEPTDSPIKTAVRISANRRSVTHRFAPLSR